MSYWKRLVKTEEQPGLWVTEQVRAGWKVLEIIPDRGGFWFTLTKD